MKSVRFFAAALLLCLSFFFNQTAQAKKTPVAGLEQVEECPTACFTIVNNGVSAGTPVQFTNQSSGAISYLWDFGDGLSSTSTHPSHGYQAAGTYRVTLYAIGVGCTTEFIGTEDVVIN